MPQIMFPFRKGISDTVKENRLVHSHSWVIIWPDLFSSYIDSYEQYLLPHQMLVIRMIECIHFGQDDSYWWFSIPLPFPINLRILHLCVHALFFVSPVILNGQVFVNIEAQLTCHISTESSLTLPTRSGKPTIHLYKYFLMSVTTFSLK